MQTDPLQSGLTSVAPHPAAPTKGRPGWITLLIVFTVIGAASSVWDTWDPSRPLGGYAFYPLWTLVVSGVLLASAVGLWKMKKWGAILYVVAISASLLSWVGFIVLGTPSYLSTSAFRCVLVSYLAVNGLIFRAFWHMSRTGLLA